MDTDLVLTLGVILAILSLPMIISAWVDGRLSRIGVLVVGLGVGMIGYAYHFTPKGYDLDEIPTVMLEVAMRLLK